MYKKGHIGIGLIVYSPFLLFLLAFGFEYFAIVFGAIFIFLSTHPDIDVKLQNKTSFLRKDSLRKLIPFLDKFLNITQHRGITHTIWYAILWGLICSSLAFLVIDIDSFLDIFFIVFSFFIGFMGIVSHLLGDIITPAGIKPLYPVKDKNYTFDLTKAKNPFYNHGLFLSGIFITLVTLYLGDLFNGLLIKCQKV